jgi:Zn-finger nucleic acid-binding protein
MAIRCDSCGGGLEAGSGLPPCLCLLSPSLPPPAPVPQRAGTAQEAAALRCPSCGAFLEQGARRCGYCEVELASIRCWRCFALSFAGAGHCAACGAVLALEGDLGETDHVCPACDANPTMHRMQVGEFQIEECLGCGGVWVSPDTLERLTRSREEEAGESPAGPPQQPLAMGPITYRACPVCTKVMQRQNFGRVSGVIVDVCKQDGVFFDADELTRILEFVARGGLRKARQRERDQAQEDLRRARQKALQQSIDGHTTMDAHGRLGGGSRLGAHAAGALLSALLEF